MLSRPGLLAAAAAGRTLACRPRVVQAQRRANSTTASNAFKPDKKTVQETATPYFNSAAAEAAELTNIQGLEQKIMGRLTPQPP